MRGSPVRRRSRSGFTTGSGRVHGGGLAKESAVRRCVNLTRGEPASPPRCLSHRNNLFSVVPPWASIIAAPRSTLTDRKAAACAGATSKQPCSVWGLRTACRPISRAAWSCSFGGRWWRRHRSGCRQRRSSRRHLERTLRRWSAPRARARLQRVDFDDREPREHAATMAAAAPGTTAVRRSGRQRATVRARIGRSSAPSQAKRSVPPSRSTWMGPKPSGSRSGGTSRPRCTSTARRSRRNMASASR